MCVRACVYVCVCVCVCVDEGRQHRTQAGNNTKARARRHAGTMPRVSSHKQVVASNSDEEANNSGTFRGAEVR